MNLLEVVYCYVSEIIQFNADIDALRQSFLDNGFVEKKVGDSHWKFKRGTSFGLDFNYQNSEAIEIQVFLKLDGEQLTIRVGNWGFPFEPLLMKKRFKNSLALFVTEITEHNRLLVISKKEVKAIQENSKGVFKNGIFIILAAAVVFVIYSLVFPVKV